MATELQDWEGKTIGKAVWGTDQSILLAFTDGSSCVLTAEAGYDGDSPEIEIGPVYSDSDKVELGLMSSEEYMAKRDKAKAAAAAQAKEAERAEFERLKAKFETSQPAT